MKISHATANQFKLNQMFRYINSSYMAKEIPKKIECVLYCAFLNFDDGRATVAIAKKGKNSEWTNTQFSLVEHKLTCCVIVRFNGKYWHQLEIDKVEYIIYTVYPYGDTNTHVPKHDMTEQIHTYEHMAHDIDTNFNFAPFKWDPLFLEPYRLHHQAAAYRKFNQCDRIEILSFTNLNE